MDVGFLRTEISEKAGRMALSIHIAFLTSKFHPYQHTSSFS
jgi:hypothetical protein